MFLPFDARTLASMSETDWIDADAGVDMVPDAGVDTSPDVSEAVSDLLPTGTVTLLLADVEGSTRLWETRADEMTAAVAELDQVLAAAVLAHGGVRPVEQGEGDSFVIAFSRASDAVACALAIQTATLGPIRLRIGLHTGEIQLRDEGNYVGPTINRTARLRDLAHGGQTVLSGTTGDLVLDRLPEGAYLTELGTHPLRDLPRPERVVQLCHPGLRNDFPPLRSPRPVVAAGLPAQLTTFIGRATELAEVGATLRTNRLVTLTGAGGVGKTRLAIELAGRVGTEFDGGVFYVDLAPVTDADVVTSAVVRALGLTDLPGVPAIDVVLRFAADRRMLVVLDNCEHLLDECARIATALVGTSAQLALLTTSREPLGVPGEAIWRVPSLPLGDDAVDLFTDRARLVRPDFHVTADDARTVADICHRLDGMPLAIELAAARVRALTLDEILDSLVDRFRLLTGGARTAVRRQQTLWASVDWSHALLTDAERALFRRLAVFIGGFDLDAARQVASGADVAPHQVLDQLTLLVDKSLVIADEAFGRTRYRMLETVRQYAQERLSESGEAHAIRTAHRDHYLHRAANLRIPISETGHWRVRHAELELDNFRAAIDWSRDEGDAESMLQLVSSLWPLLVSRGLLGEAKTWFDAISVDAETDHPGVTPGTWARALTDKVMFDGITHTRSSIDQAKRALTIAREVGDAELIARALTACASTAVFDPEAARAFVEEGELVARTNGDRWWLTQIMAWKCSGGYYAGDPRIARLAGREGWELAESIGDKFVSRACRWAIAWAEEITGNVADAVAQLEAVSAEARDGRDLVWYLSGTFNCTEALARLGDSEAAQTAAADCAGVANELGGMYPLYARLAAGFASLASADPGSGAAYEDAWNKIPRDHAMAKMMVWRLAIFPLARGELADARRWADIAVDETMGWHTLNALTVRARVALAQGDPHRAAEDAHRALTLAEELGAQLSVPDALECLAAAEADPATSARLFGAADALRTRSDEARLPVYRSAYDASVDAVRSAMGEDAFNATWAEGAALSTPEAVAYAQRGRGERKRPSSGWEALTPAELDVARLVCEGLPNKEIATRLFVSPRTVQAHLTHVYAKLAITSRSQLVRRASEATGNVQLSAQRG